MSDGQFARLGSTTAAPNVVPTRAVASYPDVPLTPLEQAARLRALAGSEMARKLFPSTTDSIAADTPCKPSHRSALAYGLNGPTWLTSKAREFTVWQRRTSAAATGTFQVEDKPSELASNGEREPRTSQGRTVTDVTARLESVWDAYQRSVAAWSMFHDPTWTTWTELISSHVQTGVTFVQQFLRGAPNESLIDTLGRYASQALPLAGVAGAVLLTGETCREARKTRSMFRDPTLKGSALPYMQAGMVFARTAQTVTVSVNSLAQLNMLTFSVWEGLARVAEETFLPVVLGGEVLRVAIAAHQYRSGSISQRDFLHRIAGPGILVMFVAGSATVGVLFGFLATGMTAGAGAWAGAKIGGLAAALFQFLGQLLVDYWHAWRQRKLSEEQRLLVNAEVEKHYGLEDRPAADR